jgi:EAL domain-containing protein (putative c-di-GMP-specific phosphodiesterase class I)
MSADHQGMSLQQAPPRDVTVRDVVDRREVCAVYQPIVDLDTCAIVGWEALARGPEGTPLETPAGLFPAAAEAGLLVDLDFTCRAAALEGAIAAGLGGRQELLVNIEPETAGAAWPDHLDAAMAAARRAGLSVTVEITERAVLTDPAALVALAERYRSHGWGIALDDVGIDPRSITVMPLLRPDLIKLDMSFVQEPMTRERAQVVHAVVAEAERSGAKVLAEGIETAEQAAMARALGADHGQGWLFGRPGELVPGATAGGTGRALVPRFEDDTDTPFERLCRSRPVRRGTKRQLLQMSLTLEHEALAQGPSALLLSTFQDAIHFTPITAARYERLAARAAFVGALARDLGEEPVPGVRGVSLDADEALRGEWDVVVLGPHFAAAFAGRDLGDTGPDEDRRFDYVLTHDRDLVAQAAHRLVQRVAPTA